MAYNSAYRRLTAEEIEELAAWFAHLTTNADPDKVVPCPEFYRPTIAYMQMQGMNLADNGCLDVDGSVLPWFMPQALVDFHADVWYAQRIGTLRAMQEQMRRAETEPSEQNAAVMRDTQLGSLFGGKKPGRA